MVLTAGPWARGKTAAHRENCLRRGNKSLTSRQPPADASDQQSRRRARPQGDACRRRRFTNVATEAIIQVFDQLAPAERRESEPSPRGPGIDLGGRLVDRLDRQAAVERIRSFLWSSTPHQVVTV